MRLRRHANLLESSLKHVSTRPLLSSQWNRHSFSTTTDGAQQEIAVLGGGITGLASAYYISKEFPRARITIYEAGPRLGGWLHSTHVEVPGGRVLFEHGPRTLRTGLSSLVTSHLVQELGLIGDTIYTSKIAPSALNRFIYYPDHLVRMPSPGISFFDIAQMLLSEPVFRGLFTGALMEIFRDGRPSALSDESVGSFFSRRVDPRVANNLVSALIHGIYAGDVWQLSVKSLFPLPWYYEGQEGSIARGLYERTLRPDGAPLAMMPARDRDMIMDFKNQKLEPEFERSLAACSVFSFRNGIQQLVDRLAETLQKNDQIAIKLNTPVKHLEMEDNNGKKVKISTQSRDSVSSKDIIVSAISSNALSNLCTSDSKTQLPALAQTHAVTVMVVNLFFSKSGLLPVEGFGYLIPQSVPFEQNPERALGVIFDSDAIKGQDTVDGTKLTVMLGGHWWDGWSCYPSEEEGINMARTLLARHLQITDEPTVARAKLQKDCIPQYTVGHEERIQRAHSQLRNSFGGRLRVVGNSYNGVGVNDCLRAARDIAKGLHEGAGYEPSRTGLDHFLGEKQWVAQGSLRKGNIGS
ncbi:Protoporphyrinogen oxidase [Glonium stellatum]|uniref:Protoporphyrinogen oxidase n=1 Tax=Glonium stellatum TaxID=574774 RepID=A0A8E2F776_9PEZI|nr:Protoporphyrinogen oxidase [Glonium stellatum]